MEELCIDQQEQQQNAPFKTLEKSRWHVFSEYCEARMANTCIVSQDDCKITKCFARQIILFAKGFI